MADVSRKLDEYTEAQWIYERSAKIIEESLGPNHPDLAEVRNFFTKINLEKSKKKIPLPKKIIQNFY